MKCNNGRRFFDLWCEPLIVFCARCLGNPQQCLYPVAKSLYCNSLIPDGPSATHGHAPRVTQMCGRERATLTCVIMSTIITSMWLRTECRCRAIWRSVYCNKWNTPRKREQRMVGSNVIFYVSSHSGRARIRLSAVIWSLELSVETPLWLTGINFSCPLRINCSTSCRQHLLWYFMIVHVETRTLFQCLLGILPRRKWATVNFFMDYRRW